MNVVQEGQLRGAFRGFKNRDTVFEFMSDGRKWRQAEYKYVYRYMYSPRARVVDDGGMQFIEVDGMDERVQVRRA